MSSFEVATVGDNCIDRFLKPVPMCLIGGNAVNVAVQLRRLGLRAAYFGAVGDDTNGERMLTCFRRSGLPTDHVRVLQGPTAYTDIAIDETGDRTLVFEEFGVCKQYRPGNSDVERLVRARHVHIGWLNDGGRLRRALTAAGVSVSQDVSVNADPADLGVEGLDIAFASAGQDRARAEEMLRSLLDRGARLAVVTCGSYGSIASDGSRLETTGIRSVDVLDTTGAGDSFIAGFITGHVKGSDLQTCLEAGRDTAAECCRHIGGFPQEALREPLA